MKELEYPFDNEYILKKKKKIRRELLDTDRTFLKKKIAVLGGSTTSDIIKILDLFLLNYGIMAEFYESEYNQYYQDAMFDPQELLDFAPDLIFIHTTNRNIRFYPEISDDETAVSEKLANVYHEFEDMWEHLSDRYHCPIIQNNMELPSYRLLGNQDCVNLHGRTNFILKLNDLFHQYADKHESFYIHDILSLSAGYGLDAWSDPFYWHMYKYALCVPAIPTFAYNLSHIIKAIYGMNKKAFVLDLDNTLWGGIVGDDGMENLELGQETSIGQAYCEFQSYLKAHKDMGVLLNISSKNEEENALSGLSHPDGILKKDDFIVIKANWDPKSINTAAIAKELNILESSLVFVDDNPAEREIIKKQLPSVAVPEITSVDQYIRQIDKHGYFEVLKLSKDDLKRSDMYKANMQRTASIQSFDNYNDYLKSLEMKAVIGPFEPVYLSRIAQLTNKSNQFNLTTRRYTQEEIAQASKDPTRLTFYGKLEDKFGDNGVVTVAIGRVEDSICHMELWLMSCRVLKRDMELALLDEIVDTCIRNGIKEIRGYYYKTAKNAMVKDFYGTTLGFNKLSDDGENSVWSFVIPEHYEKRNCVIDVN